MGTTRNDYKIVIFISVLLSLATPAFAQSTPPTSVNELQPLNFTARYAVAWAGIPIGRLNLMASENTNSYQLVVDTKTSGIAQLFSAERRVAEASGIRVASAGYIPARYASRPQKDGKGQQTTISYDKKGQITNITRVPGDDPNWRPIVPASLAHTATDPITAGFILRHGMKAKLGNTTPEFRLRTYDGARLAEMTFTMIGKKTLEVMDQKRPTIIINATRHPILGYTPKEKKKFEAGDPEINLYVSDDAQLMPLKITIASSFGEISATLVENTSPQ